MSLCRKQTGHCYVIIWKVHYSKGRIWKWNRILFSSQKSVWREKEQLKLFTHGMHPKGTFYHLVLRTPQLTYPPKSQADFPLVQTTLKSVMVETLPTFIKRKHPRKGEKKKQREKTKIQASRQPKRDVPHKGKEPLNIKTFTSCMKHVN